MSEICVVGSWHLSTVMGACLAEVGHTVRGVHHEADSIASLARGVPTVFEPGMQESIEASIAAGKLSYTTDYSAALESIRFVFLSVDTPILEEGVDLTPIFDATRRIAEAASGPYVLVVSSQVPIGTCEQLQETAREAGSHPCEVVCNPEFLRLGGAMELQREPDRVILGADDLAVAKEVEELYTPFDRPVLTMSLREAEIVKHATNAYVATSVSFIGEIAQICDDYGADGFPVSKALKLDRRIGRYAYVRPGLGFNGGTVARDVKLLIGLAEDKQKTAPMMQAILDVNTRQNGIIVDRLVELLGKAQGKTVGLLGLTYKAHTSTLRHSLTLQIAEKMKAEGLVLRAYDPIIPPGEDDGKLRPQDEFGVPDWIEVCASAEAAVDGADALVIMTDKDEFKDLDLDALGGGMARRILVDAAALYDAERSAAAGFTYITIGRGFRWS